MTSTATAAIIPTAKPDNVLVEGSPTYLSTDVSDDLVPLVSESKSGAIGAWFTSTRSPRRTRSRSLVSNISYHSSQFPAGKM